MGIDIGKSRNIIEFSLKHSENIKTNIYICAPWEFIKLYFTEETYERVNIYIYIYKYRQSCERIFSRVEKKYSRHAGGSSLIYAMRHKISTSRLFVPLQGQVRYRFNNSAAE